MKKIIKRSRPLGLSKLGRNAVLLFVFLMVGFLPIAAQHNKVLQKKVTMHQKNVSLKEVLNQVQKQTGAIFIYSSEKLNVNQKINVDAKKQELRTFLSTILVSVDLTYRLQDDYILIEPTRIFDYANSEDIVITGNIADENGEVLPGATVFIKQNNVGTQTDGNGYYYIQTQKQSKITLVFSYIGMQTKEVEYNGQDRLNIQLKVAVEELNDIVVTGYQNIQKQRVAGAVSSISHKDLSINGVNSIEQMLQGKVAGLNITNVSGEVGVRQKSRVRGTSTFLGNQEPIWVVDGIIQEDPLPFDTQTFDNNGGVTQDNMDFIRNYVGNSIAWLNPNDIEDVTVLKDASATAIYGVRAANGVIVIRTKQGQEGPLAVSYSTNLNFGEKISYKKLELMNSRERVAVSREIFERGLVANQTNNNIGFAGALNNYLYGNISYDDFNNQVAAMESVNTDWFDLLYRNPFTQSHHISLSGGTKKARLYSSIGYSEGQGTAIGNDNNSLNASLGLNSQVNDKLNISFRLTGSKSKTNGFFQVKPYEYASQTNRAIPAFNEDRSLFYYKEVNNGMQYNYRNERDQSANSNTVQAVNSNLNINYDILPELKLNLLGSYNISSTAGYSYATEKTNYITNIRGYEYASVNSTDNLFKSSRLPVGGVYNSDNNQSTTWNVRANLSYSKTFNVKHYFSTMIGVESQSLKYDGNNSTTFGYLHDRGRSFAQVSPTIESNGSVFANSLYTGTSSGTDKFSYAITDRKTNTMGYYLTLNYAYDNRYVMNFSVRGDASNRFGQFPNEKFNPVWAGGLRWNASNEEFIRNIDWITNLSLRSTFGYQRNMAANFSPSLIVQIPNTTASGAIYDQNTGEYLLTIKNLPYEDLRWEQTTSYNLGFDMSLFQNKIFLTADYYVKNGKDIITNLSIPAEYGIDQMPVNGGSLTNKGYELTAGFTPLRTKDFNWTVSLNTAKNFNEVTKVGTQNNGWRTAIQGNLLKQGYAVSSFWAFKFDGVDPNTGRPIIDLSLPEGATPGEDPTAYLQYMGKLDPDFTGGIGNSFRYKQFTLSASLNLQVGGKKFLKSAYPTFIMPTEYENLSSELNNRWTPTNTSATLPGLPDQEVATNAVLLPGTTQTYTSLYEMYNYSSDRVVDASSLRLNSLNGNYSFSNDFCKKLNCNSLSMGLSATNLFTIVSKDFHGRDPEVATGSQPLTRSYTFNINVTF